MLYLNAVCRHACRMFVVSLESFIYLPSLLIHNSSAEAFATVSHLWILWIYEYLCIKNPKSRFQANKWLCRCWTLSPVMFVKYVSLSCPLCITSISFGLPHVSLFLFVDFFCCFCLFLCPFCHSHHKYTLSSRPAPGFFLFWHILCPMKLFSFW